MSSTLSKTKGQVLLLGATGKLGHILRCYWPQADDLVLHSLKARAGFERFDLLEPSSWAAVDVQDIRSIICLSGVTPVSGGDMSLNADLAVAAVKLATEIGCGQVFCASSAAVYGAAKGALSEDKICAPVSAYGEAKLAMEHAALAAAHTAGVSASMLRIGNVAGADAILGGWFAGMTLDQFSDGTTPARSYIGARQLAIALHALTCAASLEPVINIAAPGVVHMGDLLDAAELPWTSRVASDTAIKRVELSTQCLEKHVNFEAEASSVASMVREWRGLPKMELIEK